MPDDPSRFRKSFPDRALERIDGVMDRLDRRLGIDMAVEEDKHAAWGFAHPHVVDVAHASLLGGCRGEGSLDAASEVRLRQLTARFRLSRLDMGLDFDVLADLCGDRVFEL